MTLRTEFCGEQQAVSKSNRIIPDRDIVRGGNPCAVFIDYVTKSAVQNRLRDVLPFCFYSFYMLYDLQLWALFCRGLCFILYIYTYEGHNTSGNFEMPRSFVFATFQMAFI